MQFPDFLLYEVVSFLDKTDKIQLQWTSRQMRDPKYSYYNLNMYYSCKYCTDASFRQLVNSKVDIIKNQICLSYYVYDINCNVASIWEILESVDIDTLNVIGLRQSDIWHFINMNIVTLSIYNWNQTDDAIDNHCFHFFSNIQTLIIWGYTTSNLTYHLREYLPHTQVRLL